ncbi:MAG: ABC transporter permease [Bacteroidales bacterium]|nr:ABC transporter permease [Bacteroidales bacterium]
MVVLRLIYDSILFALSSLINNKLRTFLSLLGITIGIFCIISVMATIDSIERSIRESFATLGGDILYIQKWPWGLAEEEIAEDGEYPWWKYMNRPLPKMWEAEKLKEVSTTAGYIVFGASTRQSVSYEDKSLNNSTVGIYSHEYDKARYIEIEKGRYFSQIESSIGSNVAIIGHNIAEKLYPNSDPIGKYIKIGNRKANIVGVLKKTGTETSDDGTDETVIIPLNYGKNLYNIESPNLNPYIMVTPKEGISIDMLKEEITILMRNIRKLRPMEENDFAINQPSMFTKILDRVFRMFDLGGIIIGGFAILVGGFGIANIMFVSVKERTKQIGIQKAIGAKSYLIMIQFLTEAIVLCLVGGIIGLVLVSLLMLLASSVMPFEMTLSIKNIITGTMISIIIGIISGYAPARQASKLDPVIAMNHV